LCHILHNLLTRPEYEQPIREEIIAVIKEEGWSKTAMGKLRKLDSFIKESLRVTPAPGIVGMAFDHPTST
jgi:DNA-binding SARP family transcriptional activator